MYTTNYTTHRDTRHVSDVQIAYNVELASVLNTCSYTGLTTIQEVNKNGRLVRRDSRTTKKSREKTKQQAIRKKYKDPFLLLNPQASFEYTLQKRPANQRNMNASKKIDINRSTLISLKAELSRKQEEVSLAKTQNQFTKPSTSEKNTVKKSNIWDKKKTEESKKERRAPEEENESYLKSRSALEAKARLYEELSSPNASNAEILAAQQCLLVDFRRKQRERDREEGEIDYRDEVDDTPAGDYGDEGDWVEYTDCLGRTRRCLRADLPDVQKQNNKLADSLGMRETRSRSKSKSPERKPRPPTPPLEEQLVSGDLQREALREKWEKEQANLLKKDDVHYQDILYDEVRNHGVSYYAFSKDEKQRKAQQEQLAKVRAETKKQQNAALEGRERRAQQMKARLRAAANRKRQRQGLPPLPDSDEESERNASDEEAEMERVLGKAKPEATVEPEPLVREEQPLPAVVRPWDKHKETYVMSQEEWSDKKRAERKSEFAPPSSFGPSRKSRRRSRSRSPPRRRSSSSSSGEEVIGPLPPMQSTSSAQKAPVDDNSIFAGLSFLRKQVEDKTS
ncbi:coiled-coil domain-containing protein 174 [Neocloeon triangulifer]|uniref:coiled-coil domain-containing protein 174 n=1 Tax=Neocloeon triangulifer TaxID=2078957 RepID=UPI00286ECBEC|nr:coiled-coil domain-containing protein 174 [Neocloeon triangulifer]